MNNITPAEGHGRRRVFASEYAALDSDVIAGGGTDDTEALQAILDKAPEWGGLHLVVDGAALVRGLDVHSNTTIECENRDCGFFLASGANRSILRNANPDFKTRHDRNIVLLGGTYNHNCAGQEHHVAVEELSEVFKDQRWVITMEFYGVDHLTMRDVTIRNQRTFAMLIANWYRVTMENITIELPDNMYAQNQDGIHFWGPGQYLDMRNIVGCAGDDFIALAPDEHDQVSDITDVIIDGVYLDDADQGIRLLSRDKGRLDRVTIKNVTGTFKSFGFYINPWFSGADGNFGSITFENVDLRQTKHKYEYTNPFLFRVGGRIESLTLRNVVHHKPTQPLALFEIGIPYCARLDEHAAEHSHIGTLTIDGLRIQDGVNTAGDRSYVTVMCPVDNLLVTNALVKQNSASPGGCFIRTNAQANIGCLHISGLTTAGLDTVIDHPAGRISTACLNDVVCQDATKPMIAGAGEIGSLHADGVHGAKVRE